MIKMKYIVQSKYIHSKRPKSTRFVKHPCSYLLICKQNNVCIVQHLKNGVCIINQWAMYIPIGSTCN